MMFVGTLAAVVSGAAQAIQTFLFGAILNEFVYHSLSSTAVTPLLEDIMNMANLSCEEVLRNISLVINVTNTTYFCVDNRNQFNNLLDYACEPDDTLTDTIYRFVTWFGVLGTGVFVAVVLATWLWNASGYRQTIKMRKAFYQSVLRQDMKWFDVKNAGEMNTLLAR